MAWKIWGGLSAFLGCFNKTNAELTLSSFPSAPEHQGPGGSVGDSAERASGHPSDPGLRVQCYPSPGHHLVQEQPHHSRLFHHGGPGRRADPADQGCRGGPGWGKAASATAPPLPSNYFSLQWCILLTAHRRCVCWRLFIL